MCLKLCKSKEVILDGKKILIRRPKISDLKSMLQFINSIVDEDIFINVNKKLTLKEERKWLKNVLDNIRKNKQHSLVATYKGEIVAEISATRSDYRRSHVALIGISIKKGYRNIGLGTILLKSIIDISKKDSNIKILHLEVYLGNKKAIRLYTRMGFRKVASLPKRILYKGKYSDHLIMDYPLNKI
jgi:RimJ/RimL family protein N-acetyltransferase